MKKARGRQAGFAQKTDLRAVKKDFQRFVRLVEVFKEERTDSESEWFNRTTCSAAAELGLEISFAELLSDLEWKIELQLDLGLGRLCHLVCKGEASGATGSASAAALLAWSQAITAEWKSGK